MRLCSLLFFVACGGPVYVPVEPPARPSPADTSLSADTSLPADTGLSGGHTGLPTATGHTGLSEPAWGCSTNDGYSTSLFVSNASTRALTLFWVDPSCVEVFVGSLAPGESTGVYTWTHHVFVLRDDLTREVVSSHEVTQDNAVWEVTK